MAQSIIAVPLDPDTARAYESASPEERRKIQAVVSLWIRELAAKNLPSLQSVLDDVGSKAQARGLSQEMLDSLLKGA
jgi:hypothetical protein